MQLIRTIAFLVLLPISLLAQQQSPQPLTQAERDEITELVLEQSEAAREELAVREQLQQLAQQKMAEARQKHQAIAQKLDARLKELAAARKIDPSDYQLNRKTGDFVKRQKLTDPSPVKQPGKQQP